jgi:hypothetical protein
MSEFSTLSVRPVWIASYPRSGNTFLRIILQNVFQLPSYSIYQVEGDRHDDPSADALEKAHHLPRNWRDVLTDNPEAPPIPIKTHDLPCSDAAAIYIARDGRAAIHSYYHYHKKFAFEQPSLTEVIAGACQFGSWSEHYWAWRPKTRPGTLLLLYDDLVGRPQEIISQLAQFLQLTPGDTKLPAFEQLQQRLPAFFRRGQNTDYLQEWSPGQMALFNELHGSAMEDLGFPIVSVAESAVGTVKELAQSAARLHRMYVEQLSNLGRSTAAHLEEVRLLSGQVRDLSRQVDQVLNPLLKRRWTRLGAALGALKLSSNNEASASSTVLGSNAAQTNIPLPGGVTASAGNTQSSSPVLAPDRLSAPNGDISARA